MKIKIFTLSVFVCLFLTTQAQQFKKQWAECVVPENAGTNVTAMVTDKHGNTYLAGDETATGAEYYQTHLFLIKVDASGNFAWKRTFTNGTDSIDNARALALDDAGNVYLTGTRMDTFCNICTYNTTISDVITMKYNPAGDRLWLNRTSTGEYKLASPRNILVTPGGYSLVTANISEYNSVTFERDNTLLVLVIGPNGKTMFSKQQVDIVGYSAAYDKSGNVVVAGCDNFYFPAKPVVIKFNRNGNVLWKRISEEFNFNKEGVFYSVYTDNSGNVYTNGQAEFIQFNNNPQIVTAKYRADGTLLWQKYEPVFTYTLPGYYGDYVVDRNGNSYLTGYQGYDGLINRDWLTVKYDANGNKKWSKLYVDPIGYYNSPVDIDLTKDGAHVLVAGNGTYKSNGVYSFSTVIYDTAGNQLWQAYYNTMPNGNSFPAGVESDDAGNVYTGGNSGGSCVVKYGFDALKNTAGTHALKEQVKDVRIYPNPVKSILNVKTNVVYKEYTIASADGRAVMKGNVSSSMISLNVSQLEAGLYLLTLKNEAGAVTTKFMREHD